MILYSQVVFLILSALFLVVISLQVFKNKPEQNAAMSSSRYKQLIAISSFLFVAVILTTLVLFFYQSQRISHYQLANLMLFYVGFSSSLKVLKSNAQLNQKKAGLFIMAIAYTGILGLIFIKPPGILTF